MVEEFTFGERGIGGRHPCFIIAEAGVNHNGSLELAKQLIDAAAAAGADAVKFQTFKTSKLVGPGAPKADYQKAATDATESQREMLSRLELPKSAHQELIRHCALRNIQFMSTPFEEDSADLLDQLGVAIFKVPSGEVTNLGFLEHVAAKQKPLIVSTGMCNLGEVEAAIEAIETTGNQRLCLLHCVSNYPAEAAECNLSAMGTLQQAFGYPVGYSDHTLGLEVALAAVAMGACVIEKHLTLDPSLPGPDHAASLPPQGLRDLVKGIRLVEAARGTGRKRPTDSEISTARAARKSLVAARDIPAGATLTPDTLTAQRAGGGLPPALRSHLLHRQARQHIPAGTLLRLEMVA